MSMLCLCTTILAQQYGSFKDSRDGKVYKTVKIGSQVWLAQNLNTDRFQNGDVIPEAKTREEWYLAGENKQPAWCYFDNDTANGSKYGKLYNWYAVVDPRGLAPKGWHIPRDSEWDIVVNFLGGGAKAGVKMKSKIGWNIDCNGTNSSGFSGLPGGIRENNGFSDTRINGCAFWSTTVFIPPNAIANIEQHKKKLWNTALQNYQRRIDLYNSFIRNLGPFCEFEKSKLDALLKTIADAYALLVNINTKDSTAIIAFQQKQNRLEESFNQLLVSCKKNTELTNSISFLDFLKQIEGVNNQIKVVVENFHNPVASFDLLIEGYSEAWGRGIGCNNSKLHKGHDLKTSGMSVRCIKD